MFTPPEPAKNASTELGMTGEQDMDMGMSGVWRGCGGAVVVMPEILETKI